MMKHSGSRFQLRAVLCFFVAVVAGAAAEKAPLHKQLPSRAEVREQLRQMSPADREAGINALRREYGVSSSSASGVGPYGAMNRGARQRMERLQREMRNLPADERRARLAEMRRRGAFNEVDRPGKDGAALFSRLTPMQREEFLKLRRQLQGQPEEERMARFREFYEKAGVSKPGAPEQPQRNDRMRRAFQARLAELERKKTEGVITAEESRQLERMKGIGRQRRPGNAPGDRRPDK